MESLLDALREVYGQHLSPPRSPNLGISGGNKKETETAVGGKKGCKITLRHLIEYSLQETGGREPERGDEVTPSFWGKRGEGRLGKGNRGIGSQPALQSSPQRDGRV